MKRAMEFVLVRHASTSWTGTRYCGRSDPPLSAAGRAQATALARRLGSMLVPGTRIVSGRSHRAVATAKAVAWVAGIAEIERDPRWDEADFGESEGLRFDEIVRRWPRLADAILAGTTDIDWPGGETATALAARVAGAWADLLDAGRPVVVVTHAGPIIHALRIARLGDTAGDRSDERPDLRAVPNPGREIRFTLPVGTAGRRPVLPSPA